MDVFVTGLVLLVVLAVSPAGAMLRGPLLRLVFAVVDLLATPFVALSRLSLSISPVVDQAWAGAREGELRGRALTGGPSRGWAGWTIGAVVIDLVLLVFILLGEWALAATGLAAFLDLPAEAQPQFFGIAAGAILAVVGGILFIVAAGYFFAILLEMLVDLPVDHPWHQITGPWRVIFLVFVTIMLVLSVTMAFIFGVVREVRLINIAALNDGQPAPVPEEPFLLVFWAAFALVALSAGALATAAVIFGWRGIWMLVILVVQLTVAVVRLLAAGVRLLLQAAWLLLAATIDLLLRPGVVIWNWLAGFGWARRLRFEPALAPDLGPIGAGYDQPLFAPSQARSPGSPGASRTQPAS